MRFGEIYKVRRTTLADGEARPYNVEMSNQSLPPQFLVNLGNRFVVFGPEGSAPRSVFDAANHLENWPRVADEAEVASERISQTLRVPGFDVEGPASPEMADLVLRHGEQTTLIEVKVRERDPKEKDYSEAMRLIERAREVGQNLQVWFFNLERLKAVIVSTRGSRPLITSFVPWDVWSRGDDGPFTRAHVADEVDAWAARVEAFYDEVRGWIAESGDLTAEATRRMVMSEELMQRFAVTDRELPILDVMRGQEVVASFVPRGLWMIASRGRIDIITRNETRMIVDRAFEGDADWQLVSAESRRQMSPFDRAAFLDLVGAA